MCTCLTGLGQYHLRPLYQSIKVDAQDVEYLPTNMPEEIVQRIKEGSTENESRNVATNCDEPVEQQSTEPKKQHYSITARAKALVQNNRVSFNPQMHIFNVKGTSDVIRVVALYPRETCSCPSTGVCYHILAVKMSLGIKESTIPTKQNLAMLRKNTRSRKEKRCGRKPPRPNDVKINDSQSKCCHM